MKMNDQIIELIEWDAKLRVIGFLAVTIGMVIAWGCGLLPVPHEETGTRAATPAIVAEK
jgi:hypothetical protein